MSYDLANYRLGAEPMIRYHRNRVTVLASADSNLPRSKPITSFGAVLWATWLVFWVVGCSQPQQWVREGTGAEQRERDESRCRAEAHASTNPFQGGGSRKVIGGNLDTGALDRQTREFEIFSACMQRAGYHLSATR